MNKYLYKTCIKLAGVEVPLVFRHKEAERYFDSFLCDQTTENDPTSVSEYEWQEWLNDGGMDSGYGEYTCATGVVSDALLKHDRCVIHAAAFRHAGRVWLISGPPGVGKSTQVRNLQTIDPTEFQVICGDRPALELCEEGVFVHPSPWNGKENWKGADGAFLAGLILLERGEENRFESLSMKEAIFPALTALIHTGETEENLRNLAHFTDAFLRRIPMYKLISNTVPESTRLLYEALFQKR